MADYINPQQPSTNNQQSSSLPNTDSSMKDQTILTAQVIDSPESLDYTNPNAARLENQTRYASYGKDPSLTFGRKLIWAILIIVGLLLLVSATAFAVFQYIKSNNNNNFVQTNASQGVSIPLEEISNKSRVSLGQASRLDIIGTVSISGTLTLNPSDAPSDPQKGQIYYSQSSNNMYYYNGTQFIEMGGVTNTVSSLNGVTGNILLGSNLSMLGNVLSANVNIPVSVSSIAGITGAVSVGNGLTMSGSTLINSGVVNLSGTTSQITVTNNGNGVYGLSLPQDMSISSTPTFAGINLSSPLAVTQGGTGTNSFTLNGVLFGNGTSSLQSTASTGPNQCLVTLTAGGIPTWGSCSAGGGVTGSGTNNTIAMFNSSGTIANSLLTQDVGATTVTTTGNANITGTATANAFSGNGANLTNLNGTNIATGTIDDARLSNNVALLNNTQTLTGAKTFSALLTATNGLSVTGTMVGTSTIQGTQLISTIATGTAPLQVASTTKVANLNADLLDGYTASDFALASPSGNYVKFAPTTAQTDSTTNSSLFMY
ncbi:MAG: hypothetical protein QG645_513 [Patescibacteria group bacterium]|nr:hypothetical protein [Patescibacteria group bacterium]